MEESKLWRGVHEDAQLLISLISISSSITTIMITVIVTIVITITIIITICIYIHIYIYICITWRGVHEDAQLHEDRTCK